MTIRVHEVWSPRLLIGLSQTHRSNRFPYVVLRNIFHSNQVNRPSPDSSVDLRHYTELLGVLEYHRYDV